MILEKAMPMLSALAPLILLAAVPFALAQPGRRPGLLPRLAELAALAALTLALGGAVQLAFSGAATAGVGSGPWLLALRLDVISAVMAMLVAFVGWIVLRYTRTYLDGEAREGAFSGLLLFTLAAVLLLVQSGSLAVLVLAFMAVGSGLRP